MSHHAVRSHPLPDQLPGEHTGPHPHLVQYTYFCNCLFIATTHTQIHSRHERYVEVVRNAPNSPHVVFYVHQSHSNDSTVTHPSLFMSSKHSGEIAFPTCIWIVPGELERPTQRYAGQCVKV